MKIAVIGATGMVGAQVVAEALRRGHDVIPVSRRHGLDATDRERMTPLLSEVDSAVLDELERPAADRHFTVSWRGPA